MKSPDSRSQKPENPKPEPFQLKITPEKLIVPPDGTLEVKILNPEKETCVVEAYLDSFFFLMKASGEEYVKNVGDSISTILVQKELEPNESLSLSIGYFNGEYTVKNRYKKSWHREEDAPGLGDDSWVEKVEVVKAAPSERIYYNQDRPEGRLTVTHYTIKNRNVAESYEKYYCSERESLMNRWISNNPFKTIELHLEDETEQYKMFREQFQKVSQKRSNHKNSFRWGHFLLNKNYITKRQFTSDSGIRFDLNRKGDSKILRLPIDSENWNRYLPKSVEEIDKMTDEEIRYFKSQKREKAVKEEKERKEKYKEEKERIKQQEDEMKAKFMNENNIKFMENGKKLESSETKIESKPAVKPLPKSKVSEAQRPGLQTVKTAEENVQKAPEPTVSKAGKPRSQKVETAEFKVQKPTKTADKKKGNNNKKKNPCCSVM